MNTYFFILSCILIVCSCADEQSTKIKNSFWEDGSPKTIVIQVKYGHDSFLREIRFYKQGAYDTKKPYKIERYYPSNIIESIEYYDFLGKKTGKWEQWYENGQKALEDSYVNGKRTGSYKTWLHDGIRSEDLVFREDSLLKDNIPDNRLKAK